MQLSDFGIIKTGKTPSTKNEEYWDGDIPFVTPGDLQGTKHIQSTARYISDTGMNAVKGAILPSNAICVSCIGNIGYVGKTTEKCISNQQINSIIVNEAHNPDYVYYLIKSLWSFFKHYEGQSTTLSILNKSQFSKIEVAERSREEEDRIATILNSLDDKIELNNRINENLQQQARELFKAWFVDYIPSGGTPPTEWKAGKLKDVLALNRKSIKAGENPFLPYLPIDVIPMNTFALSEVKPNEDAQSSLVLFNKDDILIGAMRVYFHRVVIAPFDGITRTTCFTLCPYDKDYLSFGLLCCDQDSSIDYAQSTSKGSTMPYAVWDGGLGDMDIVIPDKKAAQEFNALILPMIRTIQKSFSENSNLRAIRDALLPKLMSGELDVSEIDL